MQFFFKGCIPDIFFICLHVSANHFWITKMFFLKVHDAVMQATTNETKAR